MHKGSGSRLRGKLDYMIRHRPAGYAANADLLSGGSLLDRYVEATVRKPRAKRPISLAPVSLLKEHNK